MLDIFQLSPHINNHENSQSNKETTKMYKECGVQ